MSIDNLINVKSKSIRLFIILSLTIFSSTIYCQNCEPLLITITNGTEIYGRILSEDSLFIFVKTVEEKQVKIAKELIKKIETLEEAELRKINEAKADSISLALSDSSKIPERRDANLHRMFIFPTARSLKTGEGYISLSELFLSFGAIGIEELIILGGGMSIFPEKNPNQFYYFSPKITPINTENFSLSAGVFFCNNIENPRGGKIFSNGFGVIYGMGTYGNENMSITYGLGWSYSGKEIRDKPFSILGGELRLKGNVKLITENWIFHYSLYAFGITGFRFLGKHFSGDLALIYPYNRELSFLIPWLTIAYHFDILGKRD